MAWQIPRRCQTTARMDNRDARRSDRATFDGAQMIDLAIWGASGHAKVVIDAVRLGGLYSPVVLLDDRPSGVRPPEFEGLPVVEGRTSLAKLRNDGLRHIIVAFGACASRYAAAQDAL